MVSSQNVVLIVGRQGQPSSKATETTLSPSCSSAHHPILLKDTRSLVQCTTICMLHMQLARAQKARDGHQQAAAHVPRAPLFVAVAGVATDSQSLFRALRVSLNARPTAVDGGAPALSKSKVLERATVLP